MEPGLTPLQAVLLSGYMRCHPGFINERVVDSLVGEKKILQNVFLEKITASEAAGRVRTKNLLFLTPRVYNKTNEVTNWDCQ